tara:strand:+ start:684 stop:1166 length:483 start_codon:yes stop_codon:yes gene_type:complete
MYHTLDTPAQIGYHIRMKNDRNNDIEDPAMTQLIEAEISIGDLATISGFLIVQAKEGNGEVDFAEHFGHQVIYQTQAQSFPAQEVIDGKHDDMIVSFSVPVVAVAAVGMIITKGMETTPAAQCLKAPWAIFIRKAANALDIHTSGEEPKRFDAFGEEDLN